MIYGGEARSRSEPKFGVLRRHLLRGPATARPIPIVPAQGRTLYECRATLLAIPNFKLPGIHLSRSRRRTSRETQTEAAAASPFTAGCLGSSDAHTDCAASHFSTVRALISVQSITAAPGSPFTDRCQSRDEAHLSIAAIHLLRRRAMVCMTPNEALPAATHTQGDKND